MRTYRTAILNTYVDLKQAPSALQKNIGILGYWGSREFNSMALLTDMETHPYRGTYPDKGMVFENRTPIRVRHTLIGVWFFSIRFPRAHWKLCNLESKQMKSRRN